MSNYKKAFTEVYTILQELDEEEYSKIPSEVIEAIRTNRKEEYELRQRNELKKKEKYNNDVFASIKKEKTKNTEQLELIEHNENIFNKILTKIKKFLACISTI